MQREGSSLQQHIQPHIKPFFVSLRQRYSLSVFILCSRRHILENQLITINQVIKTLHVLIKQLHIIESWRKFTQNRTPGPVFPLAVLLFVNMHRAPHQNTHTKKRNECTRAKTNLCGSTHTLSEAASMIINGPGDFTGIPNLCLLALKWNDTQNTSTQNLQKSQSSKSGTTVYSAWLLCSQ